MLIDGGDFSAGRSNELRTEYLLKGMMTMGYSAVALGEKDFMSGAPFIREVGARLNVPFVASNIEPSDGGAPLAPPTRVVEAKAGGRTVRVGVFSVALDQPDSWAFLSDVHPTSARDAARAAIDELRGKCDLIVCVAHMSRPFARKLVDAVSGMDLVLVGHQPSASPETETAGHTVIVDGAGEGKQIRVVEWQIAPPGTEGGGCKQSFLAPLGDEVPEDKGMAALVSEYESKMSVHASSGPGEVSYQGPDACATCHQGAVDIWKASAHARAFQTLEQSGLTSPECLACHTTGYRQKGGFVDKEETPDLEAVGCEACHGPAGKHVLTYAPLMAELRGGKTPKVEEQARLRMPAAADCMACHDKANDPDFDFAAALPKIAHASQIDEARKERVK